MASQDLLDVRMYASLATPSQWSHLQSVAGKVLGLVHVILQNPADEDFTWSEVILVPLTGFQFLSTRFCKVLSFFAFCFILFRTPSQTCPQEPLVDTPQAGPSRTTSLRRLSSVWPCLVSSDVVLDSMWPRSSGPPSHHGSLRHLAASATLSRV